jgi:hypothetical protein
MTGYSQGLQAAMNPQGQIPICRFTGWTMEAKEAMDRKRTMAEPHLLDGS